MMYKWISSHVPLLLIFFVALCTRLLFLGTLPHTFYVEEMTNTYVGRFILLHGRDIWGHILPFLYFDKFGDFPPVLPFYLSGLGTFLFGINEFAGRAAIAFTGALLVFPLYSLTNRLYQNKLASLLICLIAAIIPWHVVLSRTTAEGIPALTLFAWGLDYLFASLAKKDKKMLLASLPFFFLGYFFYPALRLLVPLTLLPVVFFLGKKTHTWNRMAMGSIVFFFLLTMSIILTPWGRARFEQTSLFRSPHIRQSVATRSSMLSNNLGPNQVMRARIFHNKYIGYMREFSIQYLSYFSPQFLFLDGGYAQHRYFNVPDQGVLYLSLLPFFLSAFALGGTLSSSLFIFCLYLLAISPLPSAITVDFTPHVHRALFMLLPLLLIAGKGIVVLMSGNRRKYLLVPIFGALLFEGVYFGHQYSWQSPKLAPVLRNDGDKELAIYLKDHTREYERVYAPVLERLPLYYLFYTQNFSRDLIGKFYADLKIHTLDNIEFIDHECASAKVDRNALPTGNVLLVDRGNCPLQTGDMPFLEMFRADSTLAYRLIILQAR